MNVKQKIFKNKQIDQPKNRYHAPLQNQSTPKISNHPKLLSSQQEPSNKENHFHQMNQDPKWIPYSKNHNLQLLKSMELQPRMRTQINEDDRFFLKRVKKESQQVSELYSSQQFFNFRYKNATERPDASHVREDLTFGQVNGNKRRLMTSRDLLEQKKLKTQEMDEILQNSKRGLCKSFNQFSMHLGNCANHMNKKAKYRLISQLSEGQQEIFYCSKCAINLLQRGFKIEQIKGQSIDNENNFMRIKQISKFQLRLKSLEERSRVLMVEDGYKQDLLMIEEQIKAVSGKFDNLICILQDMRNKRLVSLNETYSKKEYERKISLDRLRGIQQQIQSIQTQIKDYISTNSFLTIKENEFNFLNTHLNNQINHFDQTLTLHSAGMNNRHRISLEIITSKDIVEKLKEKLVIHDDVLKKSVRERELKGNLLVKSLSPQGQISYDEVRHPFRTLFPSDQSQHAENRGFEKLGGNMWISVRQCPTFGTYA